MNFAEMFRHQRQQAPVFHKCDGRVYSFVDACTHYHTSNNSLCIHGWRKPTSEEIKNSGVR